MRARDVRLPAKKTGRRNLWMAGIQGNYIVMADIQGNYIVMTGIQGNYSKGPNTKLVRYLRDQNVAGS